MSEAREDQDKRGEWGEKKKVLSHQEVVDLTEVVSEESEEEDWERDDDWKTPEDSLDKSPNPRHRQFHYNTRSTKMGSQTPRNEKSKWVAQKAVVRQKDSRGLDFANIGQGKHE